MREDAAPIPRQGGATGIGGGGGGGGNDDPLRARASASMADSPHHPVSAESEAARRRRARSGSSGIFSTESRDPLALPQARGGRRKRTEGGRGGGEIKAEAGAEEAGGYPGSPPLPRRLKAAAVAAAATSEATRKEHFRRSRQARSQNIGSSDSAAGGSSIGGDLDEDHEEQRVQPGRRGRQQRRVGN